MTENNHPPHVQRMLAELSELADRLTKLGGFLETSQFQGLPDADRADLTEQHQHMSAYSEVLTRRVERATANATA